MLREHSTGHTEILFRSRSHALPVLLTFTFLGILLATETLLVGADFWFKTPAEGRLISTFEGNNARVQYRFAHVYHDIDPKASVRYLRRATELSPASRLYWSELSSTCESIGDRTCVDEATTRLFKLCPMVPLYHWQAAQNALRNNRIDLAVQRFRRLLELDPTYASGVWFSLQNVIAPDTLFQTLLSNRTDSEIKVGYVDFLSTQEDFDSAYKIWRFIVAHTAPFPFSSAQSYLDRVIDAGRMEEAVQVWNDLERLGIVSRPGIEKSELVFNGDFEQAPLNAGFDWRSSTGLYFRVDFSAPGAHHGAHCLRVDFTAPRNNEYEPAFQIVPVLAGHTYVLTAYARSEDLTSDSGPVLRARDSQPPGFDDAVTASTIGTTDWHRLQVSFSTGPATRAIRLSLWRPVGRDFPMDISGSFWLDEVSLRCTDCA